MPLTLESTELRDLSRQLRYLYVRELENGGFESEDSAILPGSNRPVSWTYTAIMKDIPEFVPIVHTEFMDGETLVRESMQRVLADEKVSPRAISERYVTKLRDAVRRMAIAQVFDWKKTIEEQAMRFVPLKQPDNGYMREKILFRLWVK